MRYLLGRVLIFDCFEWHVHDVVFIDLTCEVVKEHFSPWYLFAVVNQFNVVDQWNVRVGFAYFFNESQQIIFILVTCYVKNTLFKRIQKLILVNLSDNFIADIYRKYLAFDYWRTVIQNVVNHPVNRYNFNIILSPIKLYKFDAKSILQRYINASKIVILERLADFLQFIFYVLSKFSYQLFCR